MRVVCRTRKGTESAHPWHHLTHPFDGVFFAITCSPNQVVHLVLSMFPSSPFSSFLFLSRQLSPSCGITLHGSQSGSSMDLKLASISRRPHGHYGLVPFENINADKNINSREEEGSGEECPPKEQENIIIKYTLPSDPTVELSILQCKNNKAHGSCEIDTTGLVGLWPAEEVLTNFCVTNPSIFRNKRVVELGSGCGLAGLAIAACTDAAEVVLTDGNPEVVRYIGHNIARNSVTFGKTKVHGYALNWCKELPTIFSEYFDIVVAADCTFFSASHEGLAHCIKWLLKRSCTAQALLFNPERGGTLCSFLQTAVSSGWRVERRDRYDEYVWRIHDSLIRGEKLDWINYSTNHCYPILTILMHPNSSDAFQT